MSFVGALLLDKVDLIAELPTAILVDPDHQQVVTDVMGLGDPLQTSLAVEIRLGEVDLQFGRVASVSMRGHRCILRTPSSQVNSQRSSCPPSEFHSRTVQFSLGVDKLFYPRQGRSTTIEQFTQALDSYIRWYNEKRIKIFLGSLSPLEYRVSLGIAA